MNINHLRYFIEVLRRGSIGGAAQDLGITQSALTRSLQKLEQELGCELLERDRRGARPTPFGETFLDHARSIIAELDRGVEALKSMQGLSDAQVKIGVSPNFLNWIVPDAVAAMVERYPGINCRVSTATLEDLTIQLKRCEIDLAFCQSYLPMQVKRGRADPDIKFETLMRARSRAYAPAAHPLASTGRRSLADVAASRWVVPYQLSLSYRFEDAFIRRELKVPVQSINSASIQFCKASARRLGLLLLIPEHLMRDEQSAGDMVALDIPELEFEHDVGLLTRKMRNTPPAVRSLSDVFRQLCLGEPHS